MSLHTLGLNHTTAPLDVRERIAFTPDVLTDALRDLTGARTVKEAAILSTCNRTEVYFHGDDPQRVARWLERVQNPGGGFGEDLRSYRDRSWSGRGVSTASQTAWALLGLEAAGAGDGEAASRAVEWLADTQLPGGGWDEPFFTGTGFPGDFYLNYHLYRDVFPVMALGRLLGDRRGGGAA